MVHYVSILFVDNTMSYLPTICLLSIVVFDTRRGSQPADYSHIEKSHRAPVYDVKWIQSKTSTECISVSTDGFILVWDTRNLGAPFEEHLLELKQAKNQASNSYNGVLGSISMNYDTAYSVSSFTI